MPNASLLADSTQFGNSRPAAIIADRTVGHSSFAEDISFTGDKFDRSQKIGRLKDRTTTRTSEIALPQIGSGKISPKTTSNHQFGSSQISSYERSSIHEGIPQIGVTQVGFTEIRSDQMTTIEVGTDQICSTQSSTGQICSHELSSAQVRPIQIRSNHFDSNHFGIGQIDSSQISQNQINPFDSNPREISFASSISSEQFFSIHNSTPEIINELNNSATKIWSELLKSKTQPDIDFKIIDLPTGQLAEATITDFDENGVPNAGTIEIDHDANGVGWFIDETPLDNSEFIAQDTDSYLLATAESEAEDKYDLLTTVLHELAHLYGFIDGYEGFDANIETEDGTTKFIGDDFEAILHGEHLDKQAHPYDLLNTHLAPGIRKLPSELDVEILQALIATELEQNGNKPAGEELLASLTSDPLLAIANGDFSISDTTTDTFAWDTRGASGIEDGQAVLTEDSPFLSNFTQTFTVPEEAKTIQFKLIGAELGASELAPPDAFEVALLDANTNESLTAVSDLSNTDFLLNIQNDFPKLLVLY